MSKYIEILIFIIILIMDWKHLHIKPLKNAWKDLETESVNGPQNFANK